MKRTFALLLGLAMTASLTACGGGNKTTETKAAETEAAKTEAAAETEAAATDLGSGEIKIWVADNVVDFTKEKAEEFLKSDTAYSGYTVSVEAVGEGDAAKNVITDVEGSADLFGFAQDQLARLVAAGALQPLTEEYTTWATEQNDAGSVNAATSGDYMYAFPETSDNGYFLYYDKSVVTDPSSLETILADCEAAGKNFYFDIDNAWYTASFFFATGAQCDFTTDTDGNFTEANATFASEEGVVAMKAMLALANSKAFADGSSVSEATNLGAIIDGTWDADAAKQALGDNYACAELPSFKGADGKDYHMSGFSGNKLMGIKPQTEEGKLTVCYKLAQYLTGEETQLARFESAGWGPSNLAVQKNDAVTANEALSALAAQMPYMTPQGQFPDGWWDLCGGLGADCMNGTLAADASDDDIMALLQTHDDTCASFLN